MKHYSLKSYKIKQSYDQNGDEDYFLMILEALEKWLTLHVTHAKINKNGFQYYTFYSAIDLLEL